MTISGVKRAILGVKSGYICQRKKQYRFTIKGKKAEMQFSHSLNSVYSNSAFQIAVLSVSSNKCN